MKNIFIVSIALLLCTIACKNPSEKQTVETATLPPQTPQPVASMDTMKPPIVGASTDHCYQLVEKSKDKHSCCITTRATLNPYVSGYFDWSPFEKDGGHGVLKNMRDENGMLVADFVYMIEGSVQTEEVYFKREEKQLIKLSTELVEKSGKLVAKDKKKLKPEMVLPKVDCAAIKEIVDNIKSFEDKLK